MLKNLGTEFKVGLFTLVAITTLGYMFFVLSPETFENKEATTYYTILLDAAGIIPKTHVKTNGVSVGKVKEVNLEANTTRVTMQVDASVKVPVGSKIEVRSVGLLGDSFLEIVRSEDSGEYIEDGGFIPRSDEAVDMGQLMSLLGGIAKDVKKITNSFANVLGGQKGEQTVDNIVHNIEDLTADLKATSATIKSVIGERDKDLHDIVTNIRDTMRDLKEFSASLNETLDRENVERIDRIVASFDESMIDAKQALKKVNLIVDKVEKGEGTIGRLINDDNALTELEGAIKDIRDVLAPATKLQVSVDYHNEIRNDDSSQHYFNLVFKTRPDRYYLLGFTDTTNDIIETKTETVAETAATEDDPASTETKETIKTERALKYNIQVGKRWYAFGVRFGLFETTGGIATDLFLLDDKIHLALEAFEWDTKSKEVRRTAHIKAYASILFFNHIYFVAGVDDPTRTDPETGKANKELNYFLGIGLAFNDQDLKALFGTAALMQ